MANVKITELTADTNPASTDVLPFVDVDTDETKKVTIADLLENAGDGSAATPAFSFDNDKNTGIYRPGVDQLAISTGGTGRLFIDSLGNAGIGTSGPVGPLHVAGDTSADAEYSILNVSDTSDTTKGLRLAYDDVNDCGVIAASDRGSGWKNVVIAPILGNVGIGTASPAVACDVVGQVRASTGILFGSDTAAANALDDYEEGDWTPVFQGTTTPGTPVYGANGQAGKYIKVGKMVQIMAYLVITDIGGAAGSVQITGLPYNPDLTSFGSGIGTGHADGTLGNSVRLTNNSSSLLLRNNNSSVGVTTGSIYINCTYRTF